MWAGYPRITRKYLYWLVISVPTLVVALLSFPIYHTSVDADPQALDDMRGQLYVLRAGYHTLGATPCGTRWIYMRFLL